MLGVVHVAAEPGQRLELGQALERARDELSGLPLAGLVWAAPGKDPGFTPLSLVEDGPFEGTATELLAALNRRRGDGSRLRLHGRVHHRQRRRKKKKADPEPHERALV